MLHNTLKSLCLGAFMDQIDVITKKVDVFPMVKYYMDQLGLYGLFAKYVPNPKRSPVDSAQILSILVANIVCASRPLYRVEQWAADYMDGLSEYGFNASIYNDDQLARKLDLLFKADRNSLMTELASNAIAIYLLEKCKFIMTAHPLLFMANMKTKSPKPLNLSTASTKIIDLTANKSFSA